MAQNIKHIDDVTHAIHANRENTIADQLPEQQVRLKFTSQEIDLLHSLILMQMDLVKRSDSYPEKYLLIQAYENIRQKLERAK